MSPTACAPLQQITKAHDGARILWRYFLTTDDSKAAEGHVREFTAAGDYVRIAYSTDEDDKGEWLCRADLRLVAVLQEHVPITKKPKRKPRRIEGDEWKDGTPPFDFGDDQ